MDREFYGQHDWKEILCDPTELDTLSRSRSLDEVEVFCETITREAVGLARYLLHRRLLDLADDFLTDHQKRVFVLYCHYGKTYKDIATILARNYTAISHAIKGIKSQRHEGKHHGGIEKKLRKITQRDSYCQELLLLIRRINGDDVLAALQFLREQDTFWGEICTSAEVRLAADRAIDFSTDITATST